MGASSAWCDLKSFSTEAPQVARRGERGPKLVFRDRVVSENSNRPAFMLPPGSSSAAIRLTDHNIQRSRSVRKLKSSGIMRHPGSNNEAIRLTAHDIPASLRVPINIFDRR